MATNYYVSNTGSNAANGLTPATAWQTLSKITSLTVASGDSILLKAGDTWNEVLPVPRANLHYGYYSTGAMPILSGFSTLTGWIPTGGGKWFVNLTTDSMLNMVTINGGAQFKGRNPNRDAADSGYVAHNMAGASPVDNRIIVTAGRYLLGDRMVLKANDWRIETVVITGVENAGAKDTLTFIKNYDLGLGTIGALEGAKDGFGDFKQARLLRDTTLLDQYGEWLYASGKLYVQFGATNPATLTVKAATIETLMNISTNSGTTIDGIAFEGANFYGILGTTCQNIAITNCSFNNIGATAVGFYRLYNSDINYNTISNCNQMGIYVRSATSPYSNVNITGNTITRIGNYPGMGGFNNDGDYCAISAYAFTGLDIGYNTITYTGIDPIRCNGSQLRVHHNRIDYFNFIAQDKAGIYSYWDQVSPDAIYFYDRQVDSNFISNAIGSPEGTGSSIRRSSCIYLDGVNKNWRIYGNVGWNFSRKLVNGNVRDTFDVHDNIGIPGDSAIFANATVIGIQQQQSYVLRKMNITRNIGYLYANTQSQFYYECGAATSVNIQANLRAIGRIDSNYFNNFTQPCWRVLIGSPYGTTSRTQPTFATYSLFGQNDISLEDKAKSATLLLTNFTSSASVKPLTGSWKGVTGTTYSGSVTLQPYTALFLLDNGSTPPSGVPVRLPFRVQ